MNASERIPNTLTIAGSDSCGGAGIQADLKTFSALGCYGASVITTLTSQNSHGIIDAYTPDVCILRQQLDAVLSDIRFDAIKIGALVNKEVVTEVARALRYYKPSLPNVVLDPVMVSKTGHSLLDENAVEVLKRELLPLVDVLTPNLLEAAQLANGDATMIAKSEAEMIEQGRKIAQLSAGGKMAVLIKGGHLETAVDESPDWLVHPSTEGLKAAPVRFTAPRLGAKNTHGTGCTLSSAIAAHLAHGKSVEEAVGMAKHYVHGAIKAGQERLQVGEGPVAPLHHFYQWW